MIFRYLWRRHFLSGVCFKSQIIAGLLSRLKVRTWQKMARQKAEISIALGIDALEGLEKLAEQVDEKIVLFFDEYQHVLSIESVLDFERSLRSFAQKAKNVTLIFSGSS